MESWLKRSPTAVSKSPKNSVSSSAAVRRFELLAAQEFKMPVQPERKVNIKEKMQENAKENYYVKSHWNWNLLPLAILPYCICMELSCLAEVCAFCVLFEFYLLSSSLRLMRAFIW